jgi:hypothetical protein
MKLDLMHPAVVTRKSEAVVLFDIMKMAADKRDKDLTLNGFVKTISDMAHDLFTEDDDKNKFKGDMFEIFTEMYFGIITSQITGGVTEYEPLHGSEVSDDGVDGMGITYAGDRCVVQVKYRTNPTKQIFTNALKNTHSQGIMEHLIDFDISKDKKGIDLRDNSIVLFTNCDGANKHAHEYFGRLLYVIGNKEISSEVNGNVFFWNACKEILDGNYA